MVNRIPDATGWINEAGKTVAPIADKHWGVELLALLFIALCVGQLARISNRRRKRSK